jgi:hypothetical protein
MLFKSSLLASELQSCRTFSSSVVAPRSIGASPATTPNRKTGDEFLRLASDCEAEAATLESTLPQIRISIRKHPVMARTIRQQPVQRSA